ncbi:unnamed protein product [Didymodactylos carnosus]|uniref:Uncharacterized protein n=1 Tax=Didymodactylos carnosus TaxID=1234261 RepID=A0A815G058_9BILA|nr:unnamed protein product [Didymodactylos carnosus]CAF1332377.1 unnamed protein product [Didymodactylos carnosus]CAF3946992.1 unnamed protein product [Didymodactylos carnosus]CAF4187159.1 unnamed protein product [Didymodactylos carnosus]
MSDAKRQEWPELVGQSFDQASRTILAFNAELHPYNARNGIENQMLDPLRVVVVTDDNDIVTKAPSYSYRH